MDIVFPKVREWTLRIRKSRRGSVFESSERDIVSPECPRMDIVFPKCREWTLCPPECAENGHCVSRMCREWTLCLPNVPRMDIVSRMCREWTLYPECHENGHCIPNVMKMDIV
ncbi:hypothetical protein TNIN_353061 [Trichonephila inaurata madagascariensis]|uniref:Uncharacterized protein n=1 Tax=Trichonephila inaurata madagascariensis TaxID=2747483 RepID=A0A8X7CF96_9ARAC|nr:hypothetical protein TNIN_353061 [Trichonephila inaurata madagascariensis]